MRAEFGRGLRIDWAERGESERRVRIEHPSEVAVVDRDEELSSQQVLVVEEILRRVEDADGQAARLTFVVRVVSRLHQEEALDEILDVREVRLPVREVVVVVVDQVGGHAHGVHPFDQRTPRLLVGENESEVHIPAVGAGEKCGLRRARLRVPTGLPLSYSCDDLYVLANNVPSTGRGWK